MKKILFVILAIGCLSQIFGCGPNGLSSTDNTLNGQWVAEKLNAQGDRILITFAPVGGSSNQASNSYGYTDYSGVLQGGGSGATDAQRNVSMIAIRPAGDTYNVDSGSYTIDGNKLSFNMSQITDFSAPFTVSSPTKDKPGQLTIGTDVYFKVNGTPSAPQLGGQIQVSQAASDESVGVGALTVQSSGTPSAPHGQGQLAVKGEVFVPGDVIMVPDGTGDSSQAGLSIESGSAPSAPSGSSYRVLKLSLNSEGDKSQAALSVDSAPPSASGVNLSAAKQSPKSLNDAVTHLIKQHDDLVALTEDTILNHCPAHFKCGHNYILKVDSLSAPNDPHFSNQWGLDAIRVTDAWGLVGATPAKQVVVAVIDTGIVNHPDLAGRVLMSSGYDFVHDKIDGIPDLDLDTTNGPDNDPTDPGDQNTKLGLPGGSSWHGTHIAGIIAASIDNSTGIAGIATNVKILPVRAMGFQGNGTLDDVAQAIRYAAKLKNIADCGPSSFTENDSGPTGGTYSINTASAAWTSCDPSANPRPKADIINLSLGAPMNPADPGAQTLNEAINDAWNAGVLVVASAGNDKKGPGWCIDPTSKAWVSNSSCNFYPAANPHVVAVDAVNPNLTFASAYSNFGGTSDDHTQVRIAAPGGSSASGILSTVNQAVNGGYAELVGTSQAAGFVSGVAALVWSEHPAWTGTAGTDKVKEALRTSAIDLGTPGWDVNFGWGLLNACGAVVKGRQIDGVAVSGTSSLTVSSKDISFGPIGTTDTIIIGSGCGGAPVAFTATKSSNSAWLKPTLSTGTTPATLKLDVDRTSLAQGDYTATVSLASSAGNQTINVTMKVGPTSSTSGADDLTNLRKQIESFLSGGGNTGFDNTVDIGEVIILLIDSSTGKAKYYTKTDMTANYNFQFGGISSGSYYILAGVDQNLDGNICVSGESEPCFSYPNLANPQVFTIDTNTHQTDIALVY